MRSSCCAPSLSVRRVVQPVFTALAAMVSLAWTAPTWASPEMAIERAAVRAAEVAAEGHPPESVHVSLAEALQAMLRPGCRLALDLPRPANPADTSHEDEQALSECEALMRQSLGWHERGFAHCPASGIAFTRAQACEAATSMFLLHHAQAAAQATELPVSYEAMKAACAPQALCPA